ncbi:MAG: thioredoxin domain-containing protein [Candidatus Woesearchaeota archaeon]
MKKIYFFLFFITFILFLSSCSKNNIETKNLDNFAECIANSNAKLYAAFWCPHCKEQKEMFGSSWDKIKDRVYVECSNPDRTQTEICRQQNIRGYPTWKFSDGSELLGKQDFYTLAQKTGCELN